MWKFDHDQTNSHRVIKKSFGVEECWSNINGIWDWHTMNIHSTAHKHHGASRCWCETRMNFMQSGHFFVGKFNITFLNIILFHCSTRFGICTSICLFIGPPPTQYQLAVVKVGYITGRTHQVQENYTGVSQRKRANHPSLNFRRWVRCHQGRLTCIPTCRNSLTPHYECFSFYYLSNKIFCNCCLK